VSELTASTLLHVLDEPYEFYRTLRDCCGSLGSQTAGWAPLRRQARNWLGTFWAHSVSAEVNSGESQRMSFRSSVQVRLRDRHPETGSIPGSSTEKVLVRAIEVPHTATTSRLFP
jgi:hypothetical protein